MTAEISILNKSAVALAADSAVTVQSKIYKSANKLFELSVHCPVGIMIYGSAEFMGIPWETIIKSYRKRLAKGEFSHLMDYATDFCSFVEKSRWLFPKERQEQHLGDFISAYFLLLRDQIDHAVSEVISSAAKITEAHVKRIVREKAGAFLSDWEAKTTGKDLPRSFARTIMEKHQPMIDDVIKVIFAKLPLSDAVRRKMHRIAGAMARCGEGLPTSSGIVLAGFGEKDIFPGVVARELQGLWQNRLVWGEGKSSFISDDNAAVIMPFAQSEMVHTFMEGVDPSYQTLLENLIEKIPEDLLASIEGGMGKDDTPPNAKVADSSREMLEFIRHKLRESRIANYVSPVLRAVMVLPKDELAEMAESLVNLTSFKRRVSMDLETVGGAIDVAVISKGDGFVWIKRKHYFDPKLNQRYIARIFEQTQEGGTPNE